MLLMSACVFERGSREGEKEKGKRIREGKEREREEKDRVRVGERVGKYHGK